uniref:Uncharacterized protein n=1 Tax=Rhizophagus irregularis (strain DAOM 181602 / DAOM 197198 / MUCL 43194) TaxID=747089 RepID=U9TW19_RHIID
MYQRKKLSWSSDSSDIYDLSRCEECGGYYCNVMYFQKDFKSWTSGNNDIDKFIKNAQLSSHSGNKALEWIPYDKLHNIKYIEKIGVFKANWIDGYINNWDNINQNWVRYGKNMVITLKCLSNPKIGASNFINKIETDYKFYGITQDPQTKDYMMVLNDKCKKCNNLIIAQKKH